MADTIFGIKRKSVPHHFVITRSEVLDTLQGFSLMLIYGGYYQRLQHFLIKDTVSFGCEKFELDLVVEPAQCGVIQISQTVCRADENTLKAFYSGDKNSLV